MNRQVSIVGDLPTEFGSIVRRPLLVRSKSSNETRTDLGMSTARNPISRGFSSKTLMEKFLRGEPSSPRASGSLGSSSGGDRALGRTRTLGRTSTLERTLDIGDLQPLSPSGGKDGRQLLHAGSGRGAPSLPSVGGGESPDKRAGAGTELSSPPRAPLLRKNSSVKALPSIRSFRQSSGTLLDSLDSPTGDPASRAPAELSWQGESPKRFLVIRGAQVVRERELSALYVVACSCLSMGGGRMTPLVVKQYAAQQSQVNGPLAGLAVSLATVIRHSKPELDFRDLLQVMYPKADRREIQFMSDTAAWLAQDSGLAKLKVPQKALSQYEAILVVEIYDLIHNLYDEVTGRRIVARLENTFPIEAEDNKILKQFMLVVPEGLEIDVPRTKFATFISVNQASPIKVDLESFKASMIAPDVVLGRYIRNKSRKADDAMRTVLEGAEADLAPGLGLGLLPHRTPLPTITSRRRSNSDPLNF